MLCLLSTVPHLRGVGLRQAAGAVFPVCFRTVDSSLDPVVSTKSFSTIFLSFVLLFQHRESHWEALSTFISIPASSHVSPSPPTTASPASASSEPSCDVISKAQKLQDEAERSWALSQACAYYQHRCAPGDTDKETCIRIMGESCSARVLQCSLLNTMQNLEPDTQTHAQGEGLRVFTDKC